MDLFQSPPVTLVDDAESGIRYWPSFADPLQAQRWFEQLLQADWKAQRRMMYEREVDVPRLTVGWSLDDPERPSAIDQIHAAIRAIVPAPYTSAGLNLYRDGNDSVAMHHDKLHNLRPGQPIALVSLGHPRKMRIRAQANHRDAVEVELAPGSLLVMSHASQMTHEHGVPKTIRPVTQRMSVVLRCR